MTDTYQAIYDATRSRISGGNLSDAFERAARDALDMGNTRAMSWKNSPLGSTASKAWQ